MYTMGIDMGSAFAKGVLLNDSAVSETAVLPSGGEYRITAQQIHKSLIDAAKINSNDIDYTIATGYGARAVDCAHDTKTDLLCHARGLIFSSPSARTAVDVGDFSSKAFRINDQGRLAKFLLSGKCAGGSGRILRVIAKVLHVDFDHLGEASLKSRQRIEFNTSCAVFAESEAVSRIAEGVGTEDLLAGIHRALALQVLGLAERVRIKPDFALVGGGASDIGFVAAVKELSSVSVIVPSQPQLTAALGAALLAQETIESER